MNLWTNLANNIKLISVITFLLVTTSQGSTPCDAVFDAFEKQFPERLPDPANNLAVFSNITIDSRCCHVSQATELQLSGSKDCRRAIVEVSIMNQNVQTFVGIKNGLVCAYVPAFNFGKCSVESGTQDLTNTHDLGGNNGNITLFTQVTLSKGPTEPPSPPTTPTMRPTSSPTPSSTNTAAGRELVGTWAFLQMLQLTWLFWR
mmetsp:Transcript_19627/g.32726  ORF Transcript_19627/g.32726 Transcript_19627/m.32726 type:complete len:203 (-) Transcript_19627:61-669(-)